MVNCVLVLYAQTILDEAIEKGDCKTLLRALRQEALRLREVTNDNAQFYMIRLQDSKSQKNVRFCSSSEYYCLHC